MSKNNQILLLRWGGIGDTLVVLPSVNLLRRQFSEYFFRMICRPDVGSIFTLAGLVDEVISPDEGRVRELFMGSQGRTYFPLKDYFLIIGWFNRVPQFTAFPGRVIIYEPQWEQPVSQYFFLQTQSMLKGCDLEKGRCFTEFAHLPVSSEWVSKARNRLPESILMKGEKSFGLICPGSGSREKCWPPELYLELMEDLSRGGIQGLIITGPAEEWLWPRLRNETLPPGWVHFHQPPLWVIAGWMKMAGFYVGNDSGLTHLAALVGVPGVVLFLEKNLPAWEPGGQLRVLAGTALEHITLPRVEEALIKAGVLF